VEEKSLIVDNNIHTYTYMKKIVKHGKNIKSLCAAA